VLGKHLVSGKTIGQTITLDLVRIHKLIKWSSDYEHMYTSTNMAVSIAGSCLLRIVAQ